MAQATGKQRTATEQGTSEVLGAQPQGSGEQRDMSARRIIGFACHQAFVFWALFVGTATAFPSGEHVQFAGFSLDWLGLLCLLACMMLGFAVVRALGSQRLPGLFARPLLYIYAVVAAVGALLPLLFPTAQVMLAVVQGFLVGVPSAFLFTAWGRAFNRQPTQVSVPEVFLGSLVGAVVCLVFSLAQESMVVLGAVCLLPLASVVNIEVKTPAGVGASQNQPEQAGALSTKILVGTFLFGMAAGIMLLHRGLATGEWMVGYRMALVLYGAFLIGGLSLLLSDAFGSGAALNKSYRLAVFVMMVGMLLVTWPLLQGTALPGEAVVLAGFLGLQAVFISLFLMLAEIMGTDCGLAFSAGFTAVFAGEFLGAAAAVALMAALPDDMEAYLFVVLAGSITLMSYMFLFTERDFNQLSNLAVESDAMEVACERIVQRYGLSARESEILVLALRGRTNERIAQELVIAKSTADTHLRRIYAKCGVHSRQELLDLAESLR